ncbi:MAG: hypothetical protein IKW91_04595 [Bacteroidaceae bacterium]|nr:hypothetical protein [Bacteroidaceae bacterium]
MEQYPDSPPVEVLQYQRVGTRVPVCEDCSTDVPGLGTKQGELGGTPLPVEGQLPVGSGAIGELATEVSRGGVRDKPP